VPGRVEKGADGACGSSSGSGRHWSSSAAADQPSRHRSGCIGRQHHHVALVHSRAVENGLPRSARLPPLLFGGMVEGRLRLGSQQAPNSHDWMEYMLTSAAGPGPGGTGIPATISLHDLRVLDHFSIGEDSVPAAYKVLGDGNRLTSVHDDHPRSQGWQVPVNLYGSDGIRIELMNFHASEKPCCSPFTADDPAE